MVDLWRQRCLGMSYTGSFANHKVLLWRLKNEVRAFRYERMLVKAMKTSTYLVGVRLHRELH